MSEELKEGVNEVAEAPVTPPVAEAQQAPVVSEDVNTQESQEKDYAHLYENAKRALKETREKEKAEREARIALEQQIQFQAPVQPAVSEQDDEAVQRFYANEAKTDLLIKANSDPFVRDNIAELSQEIANNPLQGAEVAIQRLKASYMDTILKASDIDKPRRMASQAPTATPEETKETRPLDPNLPDLEARLAEKLG